MQPRNSIYKRNFPFIDGIGEIEVGQEVAYLPNPNIFNPLFLVVESIADCYVHLSNSVDVYFDGTLASDGYRSKSLCLYSSPGEARRITDRANLRNAVIRAFDICTSPKSPEDIVDFNMCITLAGILSEKLERMKMTHTEPYHLLNDAKNILHGYIARGDSL